MIAFEDEEIDVYQPPIRYFQYTPTHGLPRVLKKYFVST